MEDDQYFTKEDLMEFAEEVMYVLHTNANGPLATPDYTDLCVDGNQIFITVVDEEGNEFTDKISVDFRRVKRLSDLISKYTLPLAERIMAQADDFYRDINEGCGKKKKKLIKEDVDRDYEFYLNLIDIDVKDMLEEYNEAGNKSPSEILIERGYTDTDSEIMYREVEDDDHTYRLVIDFEPVWKDNMLHYYVLKDGKIPSGYTYTKTPFDEEELEEGLNYQHKFIPDKSIEELQNELNQMYADQYKYGRSIDRPRMWDINYTIKQLKKGLKEAVVKFEPEYIPRDWKDVYNLFEILGNEEDIKYLCNKHKGEKAWDTACEKWFNDDRLEEDFENPEGKEIPSAPTKDNAGIANLINALIKDEWDAIDGYQSAIMNIKSYSDDTDSVVVLEEIANDEYAHVGNLQKILNRFAPQASTIADGAREAEATIKEFS